ncbi:MAG TPA: BON domain-containing protein [Gemmatimonadaceae bacterium]|jgi:osmotically-inducible protein OsmY|nr:BON domain-containing protein [Gemmatimonadaceae bacterium]
MARSDSDIQKDVMAELEWDPSLRHEDIAVGVHDGVVTLGGFVDSYADKWRAERVVGGIRGVKGIANDIQVKLPSASQRPDPELARAAVDALTWDINVPTDRIKVKVENGWITLEGDVNYYFQKEAAERAVRHLTGVKGVTNLVTVHETPTAADVKQRIRQALERNAGFDAEHINVEVVGSKAILRGTVRSYAEWRDAERAARNAPGVTEVENKLTIEPSVFATA